MKVLSVITKFADYINSFYIRHPHFKSQGYVDQYATLAEDVYGSFETWSEGLTKLGYQSGRVFATIPEIQKQWANEHGQAYDEVNWMEDIVRAQIKKIQPDILIVSKQDTFSLGYFKSIRRENPNIRLIVSWCGAPYKNLALFQEYDFILSCIPELVDDFNAKGHACYHLNHAFDPRVLAKLDVTQMPSVDFSFIGAIVKAAQHHLGREALMVQLVQATNLEVWSSIRPLKQKQQIKILAAQLAYDAIGVAAQLGASKERILKSSWFRMLSPAGTRLDFSSYIDQRISRRAHPAVFGLPMYQKLRDSKVTLNTHIDISPRSASNMRLFEAAGVGTCLLTDWRENLRDLYEPDIEVATYRSPNECIEKVHFLLQNQSERHTIAESGQKRTLKDHTIYHRAEQLDEIIRNHLSKVRRHN